VRVLVTGGAGFIGSPLCKLLREGGHEVRVLDLRRPDEAGECTVGDVRDAATVDRALAGVDAVCHLAAKVGLGVDAQDTPDYADVNVHGTAVVLAAMARADVRKLVLASSMVVYGEGLGRCAVHGPVRPGQRVAEELERGRFEAACPRCDSELAGELVGESAPLDPRNAYAASKVAQEHFATSWARASRGAVTALRFHNVYGPGLPRDTPYAGVAAIFLSALLAGRSPRVFEDGGQRRDFVHVRDVAQACVAALEQQDGCSLAVNVGSGTPRTVGDLAGALATATGGPAPVVTGEYRLGDVRHITADSALLRERFGWQPRVEFADGVAELVPITSG
jgi:dTDP-L-rhamnose 4-epimerase